MGSLRTSSAGNNLDAYLSESDDLAKVIHTKCEIGAAFWTANSRKRTGYNSQSVTTLLTRGGLNGTKQVGVIYAFGHYARFREHGTRYNRPERVLAQAISVIEST